MPMINSGRLYLNKCHRSKAPKYLLNGSHLAMICNNLKVAYIWCMNVDTTLYQVIRFILTYSITDHHNFLTKHIPQMSYKEPLRIAIYLFKIYNVSDKRKTRQYWLCFWTTIWWHGFMFGCEVYICGWQIWSINEALMRDHYGTHTRKICNRLNWSLHSLLHEWYERIYFAIFWCSTSKKIWFTWPKKPWEGTFITKVSVCTSKNSDHKLLRNAPHISNICTYVHKLQVHPQTSQIMLCHVKVEKHSTLRLDSTNAICHMLQVLVWPRVLRVHNTSHCNYHYVVAIHDVMAMIPLIIHIYYTIVWW